jgi:hypothetical protein
LSAGPRAEADLRVGAADRPAFETAARQCYEQAGIPWYGNVVWVSSPLVLALAAPAAALLISLRRCGHGGQHDRALEAAAGALALQGTVVEAVFGAVREAVRQAPPEPPAQTACAVAGTPPPSPLPSLLNAVDLAVNGAVSAELRTRAGLGASSQVSPALRALRLAVHADVLAALERVPPSCSALELALRQVVSRAWYCYISGRHRFAFGWLFHGWGSDGADPRERAYLQASAAACCWYPHRELVMASEWPSELRPELLPPRRDGPSGQAILWSDRWGVYVQGGRRVPQWVIEHPEALTLESIQGERNKELRRILIERYGLQRYVKDSGFEGAQRRGIEPPPPPPAAPRSPPRAAAG